MELYRVGRNAQELCLIFRQILIAWCWLLIQLLRERELPCMLLMMLHDIYVTKVGWKFNAIEYSSYEDFKVAVDEFLDAKPHFKTIWDEIAEAVK